MDDLRLAMAFASRRAGKRVAAAAEWANVLSLELGWMTPGQARIFVGNASAAGLLRQEGDGLALTFDAKQVEVPRGFRPDPGAAAQAAVPAADPFMSWVERVADHQGIDAQEVLTQVTKRQDAAGGLLEAQAALLLLAGEAGLDVKDAAGEALTRLLEG